MVRYESHSLSNLCVSRILGNATRFLGVGPCDFDFLVSSVGLFWSGSIVSVGGAGTAGTTVDVSSPDVFGSAPEGLRVLCAVVNIRDDVSATGAVVFCVTDELCMVPGVTEVVLVVDDVVVLGFVDDDRVFLLFGVDEVVGVVFVSIGVFSSIVVVFIVVAVVVVDILTDDVGNDVVVVVAMIVEARGVVLVVVLLVVLIGWDRFMVVLLRRYV